MLHVIANTNFFLTEFVMQRLRGVHDIRVLAHDGRRRGKSVLKMAEAYAPWLVDRMRAARYFSPEYYAQLRQIEPHDGVLIFGVENIKELHILQGHLRSSRCTIFTWNPVRDYQQNHWKRQLHVRALKGLGMRVVTFDPEDARKHGLELVPQVYRDVSVHVKPSVPEEIDLFFVGQDKGRLPVLRRLLDCANAAGLRAYFHITPDKNRNYSAADQQLLTNMPLSYEDNLSWVNKSRCLVEVVQSHQSGPSVRSMEAAFFDKKLLTTRKMARTDALYAADRVFIDSMDDAAQLSSFLHASHATVDPVLLAKHDVLYWCRQFA